MIDGTLHNILPALKYDFTLKRMIHAIQNQWDENYLLKRVNVMKGKLKKKVRVERMEKKERWIRKLSSR